jgi:hypothetical protein
MTICSGMYNLEGVVNGKALLKGDCVSNWKCVDGIMHAVVRICTDGEDGHHHHY